MSESDNKYAAQKKYNAKTYKQYLFKLRKVEDAALIDYIENQKDNGYSPTDIVKDLIAEKIFK